MALRVCLASGCPELTDRSRCATHRSERERQRGTREERGYGQDHKLRRAHYQRLMDTGQAFNCWRCSLPINPTAWQLGHDDHDRTQYRGPECIPCNEATSGRIS